MMGHLRQNFNLYAIDLVGFGNSGRPQDVKFIDFETTIDFFISRIHKWTQKTTGLESGKFYLLGHSLGGLISAFYALRHEEQIERLILMSSIGVQEPPADMSPETFVSERESCVSRYGARWVLRNWGHPDFTFGVGDIYRTLGYRAARRMVVRGILWRIKSDTFNEGERDLIIEWII